MRPFSHDAPRTFRGYWLSGGSGGRGFWFGLFYWFLWRGVVVVVLLT